MINSLYALSFTKKYIFALSLIALFSITAFFNLEQLISSQANDADVINMSGRQRMLSQKIALFSISYKAKQLKETIILMEKSHNKLIALPMSEKIKNIYFAKPIMLDKRVREYLENAKIFMQTTSGKSLGYILKHSQTLLKDLDGAVSQYQKEAELKIMNLHKNELYLLILTLVTLFFEALFIFKPANDSVKRKTKEILDEKEYSDIITQINTNAIISVNEKFEILTFNKSAENIFGFSADEILYTKLTDDKIIPIKYLNAHNNGLSNFIKSGKLKNANTVFELEAQKKDKSIFPIRISFGAKVKDNKKIVVANIQDITKEKEKDNLLLQQSRFAAMGEMIANIAHQWRQPLSSISAMATGAKLRYSNGLLSDEEIETTFIRIKEHTQYLSDTIDDFRNFFSQNNEKEDFDINNTIKQAVSLIKASYESKNITLHTDLYKEALIVNGSSSELIQVFLNILNNAKDVLVEKGIDDKIVLIKTSLKKDFVIVNIHDNAGGIPNDIGLKIFEPYFTTKHKSQGTGIGLFMSKKIVEQHFNGSLYSENSDFKIEDKTYYGANFIIKLI